METFTQEKGIAIVDDLIRAIQDNKQYLSDIDGAIGDGDHGINMNKGFTLCREALDKQGGDLSYGLKTLGKILMMKIGGSMGPLYGKFFIAIGKSLEEHEDIGSRHKRRTRQHKDDLTRTGRRQDAYGRTDSRRSRAQRRRRHGQELQRSSRCDVRGGKGRARQHRRHGGKARTLQPSRRKVERGHGRRSRILLPDPRKHV